MHSSFESFEEEIRPLALIDRHDDRRRRSAEREGRPHAVVLTLSCAVGLVVPVWTAVVLLV